MNEYPRIGVAVFVLRRGKFIMGRRKGAHGSGTWSVPGGAIEYGESWEDAAYREVSEETGLGMQHVRLLGVTNDYNPAWGTHWFTMWLVGQPVNGEPIEREPDKFVDLGWYDLESAPTPLFTPLAKLHTASFYPSIYFLVSGDAEMGSICE